MNDPRTQPPESALPDDRLPSGLSDAIQRASALTPPAETVARLVERVSAWSADERAFDVSQRRSPAAHRRSDRRWAWLAGLAASLMVVLAVWQWPWRRDEDRRPTVELTRVPVKYPIYSSVTRVSLVQVGFQRIEDDFARAATQLDQTAESLALAEVRRELEELLESYAERNWK